MSGMIAFFFLSCITLLNIGIQFVVSELFCDCGVDYFTSF